MTLTAPMRSVSTTQPDGIEQAVHPMLAEAAAEFHPTWCAGGPDPCGPHHLGGIAHVPATLGGYVREDFGVSFARAEASPVQTAEGETGVYVVLFDPTSEGRVASGLFTGREGRRLAAEILRAVELAESACATRSGDPVLLAEILAERAAA